MKKNYLRIAALLAAVVSSTSAMAIDPPTIAQELVDGATYTLINYAKPDLYLSRTSWDGAYYLRDYGSSNCKSYAFVAHKDDDGWYFNSTDSTFIGYGRFVQPQWQPHPSNPFHHHTQCRSPRLLPFGERHRPPL